MTAPVRVQAVGEGDVGALVRADDAAGAVGQVLGGPLAQALQVVVVALDLHRHEVRIEHSGGAVGEVPLTPDRAVGEVTREVLGQARELAGDFDINPTPSEVPWSVPLDEARRCSCRSSIHFTGTPVRRAASAISAMYGYMLDLMPKLPPMSGGTMKRSLFSGTPRTRAVRGCMMNGPMKFDQSV